MGLWQEGGNAESIGRIILRYNTSISRSALPLVYFYSMVNSGISI